MKTSVNRKLSENNTIKTDISAKPLIKYEFTGGKYPVLILFELILLIASNIIFVLLCRTPGNNQIFSLTGIPKSVYLSFNIAIIILTIASIIYAIVMYTHNIGSKFELYENHISGDALVKNNHNALVHFDFNYSDIDVISIKNEYFCFSSNGTVFQIMLTSRDFRYGFKNILSQTICAQK